MLSFRPCADPNRLEQHARRELTRVGFRSMPSPVPVTSYNLGILLPRVRSAVAMGFRCRMSLRSARVLCCTILSVNIDANPADVYALLSFILQTSKPIPTGDVGTLRRSTRCPVAYFEKDRLSQNRPVLIGLF